MTERAFQTGQEIVRWSAGYAAGASAIPLPFADIAGVMAVQVTMVRRLARLHGVSISRAQARTLLVNALGSVVAPGVTAAGIPYALKAVPGIGTVLGGLAAPASAAAVTLALGGLFNRRFAEECAKPGPAYLLAVESVPAAAVHVATVADAVLADHTKPSIEPDIEPELEPAIEPDLEPEAETETEIETEIETGAEPATAAQEVPAAAADELPRGRGKAR